MKKKINDIIACRFLFFIISFYIGLWTIRIPTVKDQLSTDYVGISYTFITFAIGSILTMLFASKIIKKLSSKITVMYAGITQGFLWLVIPFITELYFFIAPGIVLLVGLLPVAPIYLYILGIYICLTRS